MARYSKDYSGEKRTVKVTVQLTPSERATLQTAAETAGATLSQHARELCLRRSNATPMVAGTRRNPQSRELVNQLTAIGNNLNQLTKLANIQRAMPLHHELRETTELLKVAIGRVIAR